MKITFKLKHLLAMAIMLLTTGIPIAYAATTVGAYATLVFGVGALNKVAVYQYTGGQSGDMTAGGLALTNIEFNSTDGTDAWVNATIAGGSTQDETNPILYTDNLGTTNAEINISTSSEISGVDTCLELRVIWKQASSGVFSNTDDPSATGFDLNTTQIQIDSSFTPDEENWGVWPYGNFSGCTVGEDQTTFYINATFA